MLLDRAVSRRSPIPDIWRIRSMLGGRQRLDTPPRACAARRQGSLCQRGTDPAEEATATAKIVENRCGAMLARQPRDASTRMATR